MKLKLTPPHGYFTTDLEAFERFRARPWHDLLLAERLFVVMDATRAVLIHLCETRLLSGFRVAYDEEHRLRVVLHFDAGGYGADDSQHSKMQPGDPFERFAGSTLTCRQALDAVMHQAVQLADGAAAARGLSGAGVATWLRTPSPAASAAAPQPTPNAPEEDA